MAARAKKSAIPGMVRIKMRRRPIRSTSIRFTHVKTKLVPTMIVPTATGLEKPSMPNRVEE